MLIKEFGGAEREEGYGIRIGEKSAILYDLPVSCKLGLLILWYSPPFIMIHSPLHVTELWEWLVKNGVDLKLVVFKHDLGDYVPLGCEIEVDGKRYGSDKAELYAIAENAVEEETPFRMIRRLETSAYEDKERWCSRNISNPISCEMSMKELGDLFPGVAELVERTAVQDYTVRCCCESINRYFTEEIYAFCWIRQGENWKLEKRKVKGTVFASVLACVLQGWKMYEECFAIILTAESDSYDFYRKWVHCGIKVLPSEKRLELYEWVESADLFHELFSEYGEQGDGS